MKRHCDGSRGGRKRRWRQRLRRRRRTLRMAGYPWLRDLVVLGIPVFNFNLRQSPVISYVTAIFECDGSEGTHRKVIKLN